MVEENSNIDASLKEFVNNFSGGPEFKTPENYFEGFQKRVHSKVNDSESLLRAPIMRWSVIVLGCFLAVLTITISKSTHQTAAESAEIPSSELLAYFSNNIDEIDEHMLMEMYAEDTALNLNVIQQDTTKVEKKVHPAPASSIDDFSEEEIYEYMLDEGYEDGEWDNL